ncbi:ABC-type polar amino acid transport system ATP-binding protein [Azorhizobium caulinodans ORS 571]|uniref:ABC-type polar amino acid transport system ATP-binding protein n=2 Tax=Xanthobacteraceae TaxID=335928 RepID=A8I8M1_AZOC5|nr:ABC-type polar amino acid transport system ATP-binding protein [Azorhizobium caulinodans ORS 571]
MTVGRADVIGLIGPSGSGKSTILRVLMGLLPPVGGTVKLDGEAVNYADAGQVRRLRDRIAIVFQQYNLFQNMSVLENVCVAPIKIKKRPRKEVEEEARELLAKVGLGDKLKRYPDELSGGQQQRVAIVRALALHPEILLLDEVTAALDPELVSEVLDTIRLLAKEGMTMLIVSHEMAFIREVASRVVFMAGGRIVETGAPAQIFDAPAEARTRDFVSKILRH